MKNIKLITKLIPAITVTICVFCFGACGSLEFSNSTRNTASKEQKEMISETKVVSEYRKYSDGSYHSTTYKYDDHARLISLKEEHDFVIINKETHYYYDKDGRLVHEYEDGYRYTRERLYEYDSFGKLISCERILESHGKKNKSTTSYEYDEKDRLIHEESENYVVNYEYDEHDNVVKEDHCTSYYLYEFNDQNQLIRKGYYIVSDDSDVLYEEYLYYYDEAGLLVKTLFSMDDVLEEYLYYYDEAGLLVKTYSSNGVVYEEVYDNGLLVQEIISTLEDDPQYSSSVDSNGNKESDDLNGRVTCEITYTYDVFEYEA